MIFSPKDDFNLARIADSGQCFRFNQTDTNEYSVIAFGKYLKIKDLGQKSFELNCSEKEFDEIWKSYFDLDTNYTAIRNKTKNDPFLKRCAAFSEGIRILNQDKWEMVISFIISQRKSIPAIKTSIERLATLCGDEISEGIYAFPSPFQILSCNQDRLAECGLGYRLEYIRKAAELFYENPNFISELELLSDEELLEKLKTMQGVGDKVASCIALFGFHRLNFFPKDVWINRALSEHYSNGFDFDKYAPYNGVIQQYIFFAYRSENK